MRVVALRFDRGVGSGSRNVPSFVLSRKVSIVSAGGSGFADKARMRASSVGVVGRGGGLVT